MSRDVLPDSRARETKGVVWSSVFGWMVPVFCANCGADGGLVPEQNMTFAFYLCNPCCDTWGVPAGMMVQPDQVFWGQVKADQEGGAIGNCPKCGTPNVGNYCSHCGSGRIIVT